jgi:hypothetical protein
LNREFYGLKISNAFATFDAGLTPAIPMYKMFFVCCILHLSPLLSRAQDAPNVEEIGESMKAYIKKNHIEAIEDVVHQFTSSKIFLNFLLEQGHDIDPATVEFKRRDISVGKDVDVYVKHFSEHQNYTMIMVPVDVYSQLIYDTLLFSVLEVSDEWLRNKYPYQDLENLEVKEKLLALENHDRLARHMYDQGRDSRAIGLGEVDLQLHESYISSSSIQMHVAELTKEEKKQFRDSWGAIKKAFAHDVDLNIEMNVYIFGTDDMKLFYYSKGQKFEYMITPNNIFTRHKFNDQE